MAQPQDLLLQQKLVVVGDGRIGRAFVQMAGPGTKLVGKGQFVVNEDKDVNSPIIVATHCSDLNAVLEKTCKSRWKDLVFVQNGMIQPWLKQNDLQENTQILLFMSSFPENPSEPKGRMRIQNGGRNSCAWGRWGDAMSQIMQNGGMGCSVLRSHEEFLEVMIEKLLWSSIFWLLSDALGSLCVGELAQSYKWAVQELTSELLPLALGKIGSMNIISSAERSNERIGEMCERISEDEMLKRLCAYSFAIHDAVPSRSVALSEFQWRNGWFLEQDITSCHLRWLRAAGVDSMIPRH